MSKVHTFFEMVAGLLSSSWFINNFLPGFLATFIGILLGVPISLWINKKNNKQIERDKDVSDKKILMERLTLLDETMNNNRNELNKYLDEISNQNLSQHEIILPPKVDVSIWDILKEDIANLLPKPILKQKLGFHFQRLELLLDMHKIYLSFFVGMMIYGEEGYKQRIKVNTKLQTLVTEIFESIDELRSQLTTEINNNSNY